MTKEREQAPARGQRVAFLFCALHLWTVFSIVLSNAFQGLAALATPWAGRRGAPSLRRIRPLLWPTGLLVGWSLLSIATSSDRAISWDESSELLALATLPLCLYLLRGRESLARVVDGVVFLAVLVAVYGLLQTVLADAAGDPAVELGLIEPVMRARGPFSHYMTYSGVVLLGAAMLLAQIALGRLRSWWLVVPVGVLVAGLAASRTRGAWLALLIVAAAILGSRLAGRSSLSMGNPGQGSRPLRALALGALALLVAILAIPMLRERALSIADLDNETNRERLRIAGAGLDMIAERPLVGHGPGMAREIYPRYAAPTALRMNVEHLHNSYLQIAAESGVPALIALVWLFAVSLRRAHAGWRESARDPTPQAAASQSPAEETRRAVCAAAFFGLLAFSIAGLFEDNWSDGEVQRLALFSIAAPFCVRLPSDPRPALPPRRR